MKTIKGQFVQMLVLGIFLFGTTTTMLQAQTETTSTTETKKKTKKSKEERNWQLTGYIKDMRTFNIVDLDQIFVDNLLHNRLRFKWFMDEKWTTTIEMRNRIFYGNTVNLLPNYADLVDLGANDYADMSFVWLDRNAVVGHSIFDRAFVEYTNNDLEVRLGRQRINWGINTVWNPHDLFNAFNFFDFDYEERPGSDALRVTYYTNYASSVEFAVKATDNVEELVAAGLWKINKWNYDFQFLGGVYRDDVALGVGWAGGIGEVGFKGENSLFLPFRNTNVNEPTVAATIAVDYSVKNWYFIGSMLYNSAGGTDVPLTNLATLQISPKNLYPYKYAFFTTASYQFSPIVSGSLGGIYSPSEQQALFINPSLSVSLKDNWTLDGFGQVFMSNVLNANGENEYQGVANAVFVRMKWSY